MIARITRHPSFRANLSLLFAVISFLPPLVGWELAERGAVARYAELLFPARLVLQQAAVAASLLAFPITALVIGLGVLTGRGSGTTQAAAGAILGFVLGAVILLGLPWITLLLLYPAG